jgi:hypothetical protein
MKLEVIDAIWNKMLVTYGSEWTRKFGDQPLDEVKGAWADDLARLYCRADQVWPEYAW